MKKKTFYFWLIVIWILQMAVAFAFCVQKKGFHEDEYYTYYSTARTNGFYVEDGEWMDQETIRDEFVVLPDQRFQYGLVKQVQSWDVHPPVYYWVFHTVASFLPGVFSKWIGLSVNLLFHGVNILLLAWLCHMVSGGKKELTLVVSAFYWLTPAALSGVLFIRMYEMLTTWVLLCAILHVLAWKWLERAADPAKEKLPVKRFLLPTLAVTYLGFLTHYYYVIFAFFMAAAFALCVLLRERRIRNVLWYAGSLAAAFLLSYLTYPACLGQMFRGQRGAQATENFFDLSNTWERFCYFYDIMNEYVFGRYLLVFWVLLAVLLLGMLLPVRKRAGSGREFMAELGKRIRDGVRGNIPLVLLCVSVLGYLAAVSKTGLMYEGTSLRYQLPVYGMVAMLLLLALRALWKGHMEYIFLLCLLLINVNGLASGKVQFLYPEAEEVKAVAVREAAQGTEAVYLYREGDEWCIWSSAEELMQFPGVYFLAADRETLPEDERIRTGERLIAYVGEGADAEKELKRLLEGNPALSGSELVAQEKYCSVYLLR